MSEVREGDRQSTASAIIISQEMTPRVLLVHHKKFNAWMQPGGHAERDEAPHTAAIREAFEETGLDITPFLNPGEKVDEYAFLLPIPRWIMEQKIPAFGEQPTHFHLDSMFVVHVPWQEPVVQEAESHGIGWFTWEELATLKIFENTRYVISQAMNEHE